MEKNKGSDAAVAYFSPVVGSALVKPECPYMKGYPCGVFMASKDRLYGQSVCCYYDNSDELSYDDNSSSVSVHRCCWLPSSVKNGFREARYYNGVLHGEGV